VFSVIRQTWRLTDDPRKTKPEELALATNRTAADAADLARDAAAEYSTYGFHKPSGAWWAADGGFFIASKWPPTAAAARFLSDWA
jgi:hypothetical protein